METNTKSLAYNYRVLKWSFSQVLDRVSVGFITVIVASFFVTSLLGNFYVAQTAKVVDGLNGGGGPETANAFIVLMVILSVSSVLPSLTNLIQEKIWGRTFIRVSHKLSEIILRLTPVVHASFRDDLSIGKLYSAKGEKQNMNAQIVHRSISEITDLLMTFVMVVVLFPQVTYIVSLSFIIYIIWSWQTTRVQLRVGRHLDKYFASAEDFLKSRWEMPFLMFFLGMREKDLEKIKDLKKEVVQKDFNLYRYLILHSAARTFVVIMVMGWAMWVVLLDIEAGVMGAGNFFIIATWLLKLKNSYWRVSDLLKMVFRALPKIERLYRVAHLPKDEIEKMPLHDIDLANVGIELKHVSFTYPRSAGEDKPALRDINLQLKPGMTVGIVGESGSGKTTLGKLIFRASSHYQGSIFVVTNQGKKIPIENIPYEKWSREVAVVMQDSVVYGGTVREVLTYGHQSNDLPDERLWSVLGQLKLEDFFRERKGLETDISENGVRLSGGQRQRMLIANALLRKPQLLLLDEATSALDAETQDEVMRAIDALLAEHSGIRIIIAHRISTLEKCSKILVMRRGCLVGIADSLAEAAKYDANFAKSLRLELQPGG